MDGIYNKTIYFIYLIDKKIAEINLPTRPFVKDILYIEMPKLKSYYQVKGIVMSNLKNVVLVYVLEHNKGLPFYTDEELPMHIDKDGNIIF